MEVKGTNYTDKQEAGQAILDACKQMNSPEPLRIGNYRGFTMELCYDSFEKAFQITLKGKLNHAVTLGTDIHGNLTRLDHAIARLEDKLSQCEQRLIQTKAQLAAAKRETKKDFSQEEELAEKLARLGELNALLDINKNDAPILDSGQEELDSIPKGRENGERQR